MIDRSSTARLAAVSGLLLFASGCSIGSNTRVAEAEKMVQSLRADNAQLKDSALTLKVQNQDLTQRAVDDARSLQALETANSQYERSIQGYQDEREQYRAAFQDLKSQVRTASGP